MLRDGGHRSLIACGDFNVTPAEWEDSGYLEVLESQIVTAGNFETCRVGNAIIDYFLVSTNIVRLILNVKLQTAVPWYPHCGISFEIDSRPEFRSTLQLFKSPPNCVKTFGMRATSFNGNAARIDGTPFTQPQSLLPFKSSTNPSPVAQKLPHTPII